MNTERFIIETLWSGGTSIVTEYMINDIWVEVHREPIYWTDDISKFGDPFEFYTDGAVERKIYYTEPKENAGIWYNKKPRLPRFTNTEAPSVNEPVWERLAETNFYYTDEFGEILEQLELTESLNRIEDDMMYFNFNWIPEDNNPTPLKKILSLMDKKIDVEINFHDVEGIVMYKVKLLGFRFVKIQGLRNYNWNDSGIKELPVQYNFDEEQIIV